MLRHLSLFARLPVPGRTKTRLAASLAGGDGLGLSGEDADAVAARLAEAFLRDTVAAARAVAAERTVVAAAAEADMEPLALLVADAWEQAGEGDAPPPTVVPQWGDDLGARMAFELDRALEAGADAACILGTDAPDTPPGHVDRAFALLDGGADLVLGPGTDGGFWLIGAARPVGVLLEGIAWSSGGEFLAARHAAERAGRSVATAPEWSDVDDLDDLRALAGRLAGVPDTTAAATRAVLDDLGPIGGPTADR